MKNFDPRNNFHDGRLLGVDHFENGRIYLLQSEEDARDFRDYLRDRDRLPGDSDFTADFFSKRVVAGERSLVRVQRAGTPIGDFDFSFDFSLCLRSRERLTRGGPS